MRTFIESGSPLIQNMRQSFKPMLFLGAVLLVLMCGAEAAGPAPALYDRKGRDRTFVHKRDLGWLQKRQCTCMPVHG